MSAPIGALRARVRLERPVLSTASGGGLDWEEVDAVWAALSFMDETCRFELRMRRDVQRGWRVAIGDRRFRINAMRDGDDRGARLLVDCEEEMQ